MPRSGVPLLPLLLVCVVLLLQAASSSEGRGVHSKNPSSSGSSVPFKPSWQSKVPGFIAQYDTPITPPSSAPQAPQVALVWTYATEASSDPQLSAVSLKDGKVLWTNQGWWINVMNQTYLVPYVSAGYIGGTIFANYYLSSPYGGFVVQGFQRLDPNTGGILLDQETTPFTNSWTDALPILDALYVVSYGTNQNSLLRLRGPNYDPSHPAANYTWPDQSHVETSSTSLLLGQQRGVVLHTLRQGSGNNWNTTLQLLEPLQLRVLWSTPAFPGSAYSFDLEEPFEEKFVATTWATSPPYVTQMEGWAIGLDRPQWQWIHTWPTDIYVPIDYSGTALSSNPDVPSRPCGLYRVWSDQQHSSSYFFCYDIAAQAIAFNITIMANNVPKATFMTFYKQWALLLSADTGDLVAVDCFSSNPWANPSWTMAGQVQLQSLTWSVDKTYLLAQYSSPYSLARWDVVM